MTERHPGVVGDQEQRGDGGDPSDNGDDDDRCDPAPFVPVRSVSCAADDQHHRDEEPDRQRREHVGDAEQHTDDERPAPSGCERYRRDAHAITSPSTRPYSAAIAGNANRCAAWRAAAAMRFLAAPSVSSRSSAVASCTGSCRSTSSPLTPSATMSRVPGELVATTGTPHAIASISTLPNPSYRELRAKTSACAMNFHGLC